MASTTTLTIGNDYLSTTAQIWLKEWRDALYQEIAFCHAQERKHGAGGPSQAGGTRILQPIGIADPTKTTGQQTGYERIDLTSVDATVPASFEWATAVRPVLISMVEERVNQGEAAMLDLLEIRTRMAASQLKLEFNKQMVMGGVSGWEKWNTLNGVDFPSGAFNPGFLEQDAVGSQSNIIGGVSKATYSYAKGWQNQVQDGANSFNANGLAALYALGTNARAVSEDGAFDVWLGSINGFNNLKRTLQAQERYIDKAPDGGKLVQTWDGIMIDVEPNMPNSGNLPYAGAQTGTTPISFYGLNMSSLHVMWDPAGYFEMTDFQTVSGEYDVRVAKLHVVGQLITRHLGSQGLAHSLETF